MKVTGRPKKMRKRQDDRSISSLSWDLVAVRKALSHATAEEGSLRPVVDLLSGNGQLQAMLLAWIPSRYGHLMNTGIYAVDMFVTMLVATMIVSALGFLGSSIQTYLNAAPKTGDQATTSVRVEHYRLDKYGETVVNVHYEALAWLISERSQDEDHGEFRMVPYDSEMGQGKSKPDEDNWWDDSSSEDSDDDEVDIPKFNILPRGAKPLLIEHEDCTFEILFELSPEEAADTKSKATTSNELRKRLEPNIIIRRALEVEREKDEEEGKSSSTVVQRPDPTIAYMQMTLGKVTKSYTEQRAQRKTRARYVRGMNGGWYWSSEITASRGLDSVALDLRQEDMLRRDLKTFMDDKAFYVRMGLPYRRGYLFSGPPGKSTVERNPPQTFRTGKTSLINAISASYNRDLYYMNLKEIADDGALQSAFDSVPRNSIIVFEDVDAQSGVVHSRERRSALRDVIRRTEERERREKRELKLRERAKKRLRKAAKKKRKEETGETEDESDDSEDLEDKKGTSSPMMEDTDDSSSSPARFGGSTSFGDLKIGSSPGAGDLFGKFTLSTLLNCMDGHTLANGTMIVMTSNHPEVLDPALIRPGRIDLHLRLGYCTRYQLRNMYRSVMDDTTAEPDFSLVSEDVIAPCDAMRIMILFRHAPADIPDRLRDRCAQIMLEREGRGPMMGTEYVEGPLPTAAPLVEADAAR
ncbi:hypothetical protein HKX48_000811 [Thoreauomyces humboldtii]|nr:hypothetical protein HKX48_000811 [Thoreauomyces humboldtii]